MIIDFLLDDLRKAIAGLEATSFADVVYDSSGKTIDFYNVDGESVGSIDASDFIVDGMLDSVTLSGSTLHFVFNTDSGKEAIDVDLSTIIPDIDSLSPVSEFPASAETGTLIALASGDTVGIYQYDGENWVVAGGDTEEILDMIQRKEEVVASALTELHEAIPDMSEYWTSGETKDYVDALADEVADIERVTATALTELHDSILDLSGATADFVTSGDVASQITAATQSFVTSGDVETMISAATDDFVTTADTQEIIDRLQTVETVASSAFDYLETMMETKEEVIAEALTDLEDTKVASEDIKHIVKLTQAEYDLIATPDPETLYIIVNA